MSPFTDHRKCCVTSRSKSPLYQVIAACEDCEELTKCQPSLMMVQAGLILRLL